MLLADFQLFALLTFIDERPGGRKNDRDPRARGAGLKNFLVHN
jgi:hypothetical protein